MSPSNVYFFFYEDHFSHHGLLSNINADEITLISVKTWNTHKNFLICIPINQTLLVIV